MNRSSFPYWLVLLIVVAFGVTGCIMPRSEGTAGDIQFLVPTVEVASVEAAVQGDTDAVVRIQPATQQLNVGSTTTVEIRIENVTNLVGVDIELRFDPTFLQVQDIDPDKGGTQIQPGDFLAANFIVTNEADNSAGVIRYVLTQLNVPPVNGQGLLASITFIGFSPGSSDLTFSIVKLAGSNNQFIAAISEPGQVTVTQSDGEPTATFTPIPVEPTTTPIPVEPTATPIEVTASPTPVEIPTATPFGVPPGATIGFCYRVLPVDTFYSLTYDFKVSAYALNLVNDLWPRNYVFTNQAIFIPTRLGHGPNFYVVKSGDSLPSIADRCHLPVSFVAQVNNLEPEAEVSQGQILHIPVPPFPPPSRYNYPSGSIQPAPCRPPRYSGCDVHLPYRPGPALGD